MSQVQLRDHLRELGILEGKDQEKRKAETMSASEPQSSSVEPRSVSVSKEAKEREERRGKTKEG